MNKTLKKGLVFLMIMSSVSVIASTRATLYLAGFVETICNLTIVPRLNFADGLDMETGTARVVADAIEESNLVAGYTIRGWSLNTSQLCDSNQTNSIAGTVPSATNTGACIGYTVNYTGVAAVPADSTITPVATIAVGADSGSAVVLSTVVPTPAGSGISGIIQATIEITTTAPATPLPAGLYDDTLVLEMVAI